MERIGVFICRFDDEQPDHVTQVAGFSLPSADVSTLQPETALDELEATTHQIGQAILRRTLLAQWELIDRALVAAYCQAYAPDEITCDGRVPLTVASRFGIVELPRQMLTHGTTKAHVMPGNTVLPEHEGIITTRGLQEWACLLPQDLSCAPVARLLGWQTQEAQVLSDTTVRTLSAGMGNSSGRLNRRRSRLCSHGRIWRRSRRA